MSMVRRFRRRGSRALTLIEVMIAGVLFLLIAYFIWSLLVQGTKSSERLNVKVDLMRSARMASLKISRELKQAVEVFSPTLTQTKTSPVLIYLTHKNELIVLYVDKQKRLMRLNRTDGDKENVLAKGVKAFRVFRKGRRLVNFHIAMARDAKDPRAARVEKFNLVTGVTLRNNFN